VILSGSTDWKPQVAGSEQSREQQKVVDKFRHKDAINQMYTKARWKHFRLVMLGKNPICQRLIKNENGQLEQCHSAAVIVHHRVSPRVNASLFLVPSNTICFCELHHPNTEGDPRGFTEGFDFVATVVPKWNV
jgi:hypothetical protein